MDVVCHFFLKCVYEGHLGELLYLLPVIHSLRIFMFFNNENWSREGFSQICFLVEPEPRHQSLFMLSPVQRERWEFTPSFTRLTGSSSLQRRSYVKLTFLPRKNRGSYQSTQRLWHLSQDLRFPAPTFQHRYFML